MALPGESVAVKPVLVRAQQVALALLADLTWSVAPKSGFTVFAMVALRVEHALEADPGGGIAVARVRLHPVPTAIALDAGAAGNLRIAVVVVGADGAACA